MSRIISAFDLALWVQYFFDDNRLTVYWQRGACGTHGERHTFDVVDAMGFDVGWRNSAERSASPDDAAKTGATVVYADLEAVPTVQISSGSTGQRAQRRTRRSAIPASGVSSRRT
jgi:hypothetical protein